MGNRHLGRSPGRLAAMDPGGGSNGRESTGNNPGTPGYLMNIVSLGRKVGVSFATSQREYKLACSWFWGWEVHGT